MGQHKDWCFTMFEKPNILEDDKIRYFIYQEEQCPTTLKHHWQGYIELYNNHRMSEVKLRLNSKLVHVEPRMGSQQQAIDYCQKSDTKIGPCVVYGKPARPGTRCDLDAIWDCMESGMTSREILFRFGGKALRFINMITQGLKAVHSDSEIDKLILINRDLKNYDFGILQPEEVPDPSN